MPQLKKSRLIGIVLVLIAIAVFTRVWLFGSADIAGDMLLGVVNMALFFNTVFMLWQLHWAWKEWNWYRTENGRRFRYTVIESVPELPKKLADWRDEILDLGFEPLGAYTIGHRNSTKNWATMWVYIDPTGTIRAEISSVPPVYEYVGFITQFENGFALEITYNFHANVNVDQPAVFGGNFSSSIREAYQYHLHHYDRFDVEHGHSKQHDSIEDCLPNPEANREQMKGVYLNRMQDRLKWAGAFGVFALASVIGMVSGTNFGGWIGVGLASLATGLSLLVLDYEAIAGKFRPIDEDRVRKEKAMTDKKNAKRKGSKRSLSTHEASVQLNYEVRDLLNSGYTPAQIHGVLDGEYTLEELLQMTPGNTQTLK